MIGLAGLAGLAGLGGLADQRPPARVDRETGRVNEAAYVHAGADSTGGTDGIHADGDRQYGERRHLAYSHAGLPEPAFTRSAISA